MAIYEIYKFDYCHWCGEHAKRHKTGNRHVYCSAKCKMAAHRAYKKYVTLQARQNKKDIKEK